MDLSFRHDLWWSHLPASPRDAGSVHLLVVRPRGGAPGERQTPESVEVTVEGAITGDRWVDDPERQVGAQVSLINVHVVRDLAGERAAITGDNLHVDLDLSEANLPIGSRLKVGGVELEVGDVFHRPCRSFHERLGGTAAKRVARAGRKGRRARGVLCKVVTPGSIRVGDAITVLR